MIHYLAVHDLVWINNTVTGKTLKFDYEALEEVMAAQYSYGDSTDVLRQAAFLLNKALTRKPFEYGNLRTGFIALLAFLTANGFRLKVDDSRAAEIIRQVSEGGMSAADAITEMAEPSGMGLRPGVTLRVLVSHLCNERREALRLLAEADGPQARAPQAALASS